MKLLGQERNSSLPLRPVFKDRKKQLIDFSSQRAFEYEFIDVLIVEGKEEERKRGIGKVKDSREVEEQSYPCISVHGGEEYTMESLILAQDER